MTRHLQSQHEAHTDQMVALTRQCIVAVSDGGELPSLGEPSADVAALTYDETVAWQDEWTTVEPDITWWLAYHAAKREHEAKHQAEHEAFSAELASIWEGPPPGFGLNDHAHPLAAWLPVICWLGFAGCVWLLAWAWFS